MGVKNKKHNIVSGPDGNRKTFRKYPEINNGFSLPQLPLCHLIPKLRLGVAGAFSLERSGLLLSSCGIQLHHRVLCYLGVMVPKACTQV